MMDPRLRERPVNPITPVVVIAFAAMIAIEVVLTLAGMGLIGGARGVGWRSIVINDYAFAPAYWEALNQRGDWSFDTLKRFVTYTFINGSFMQAAFSACLFLALGKFVGDVFRVWAVVVLYILCAVVGAAVYAQVAGSNLGLVGALPPVYGFIGAHAYINWRHLGEAGDNRLKAFRLIGFLLGIQLLWAIVQGSNPMWIAEVSAFVTGFASSILLAPGGWQAFVERLRRR